MYPKIEGLGWRLGEPQTKVRWSSLGCIIYNNPEPLSQARVDGDKRGDRTSWVGARLSELLGATAEGSCPRKDTDWMSGGSTSSESEGNGSTTFVMISGLPTLPLELSDSLFIFPSMSWYSGAWLGEKREIAYGSVRTRPSPLLGNTPGLKLSLRREDLGHGLGSCAHLLVNVLQAFPCASVPSSALSHSATRAEIPRPLDACLPAIPGTRQ